MTAGTHACLFIGPGVERLLNSSALFSPQLGVHLSYVHKNADFLRFYGAFRTSLFAQLG